MKVVDQLKQFILDQDVIPKSIKIDPNALVELETEMYVYTLNNDSGNVVKRFMGIELIPTNGVVGFEMVEKADENVNWIVKKEVKKIREKYILNDGELSKDISLLFSYLSYLERELEDKKNYLNYLKEKEVVSIAKEQKKI